MNKTKLDKLIRSLSDPDPSVRRAAAEALSLGDERAVYPLIKALRDDNFGVQDAAIRSLMSMKNEVTAYMVLPLLREDSFLRNTAIIILRDMGNISVPLLSLLLNDKDDDVRKFAIDIIHDIQFCDYPDKILALLETDPNPNVRAAAAKTLGALNYKTAVPKLINALTDDEWVCFSALEALTNLRDERAIDPILSLTQSPSEAIRLAAIETLGKIGSPLSEASLLEHVSRSSGYEKKATIISLLQIGSIPSSPDISDELISMLIYGEWDEKLIAIKGLLLLHEERAIYHMIDIAGSIEYSAPDREEKVQFIKEAILSFGCNETILNILSDENMRYRGKSLAIEIIGELKCSGATEHLIGLINSNYRDIRRSSIETLSQLESEEVRDHLIEAVRDHDSHVRKTAVIALGKIGDMSAFESLMKFLQNETYYDVIDEFIKSLLQINAPLLLSRILEFPKNIQSVIALHAAHHSSEISC